MTLSKDSWGTSGSNGGHAALTFSGCKLRGALKADSISSATVSLTNKSTLTGAASGSVTVTKDATSTWTA